MESSSNKYVYVSKYMGRTILLDMRVSHGMWFAYM